jgi:FkbM family methyltransferase
MLSFFSKKKKILPSDFSFEELEKLHHQPFGTPGYITVSGRKFHFHDAQSFYDSYHEIIAGEIYRFKALSKQPFIIDCGANMGVSVLFFSTEYPGARILAFEPELPIYRVLEENVRNFDLQNVQIIQKAVWNSETTLEFYTDKGMGGSVENVYSKQAPQVVKTVRLKDCLDREVDFLKLDIEGAEYTVLQDCREVLHNVKNLFVEYHSYINKEQHLDDILLMLKDSGYRYHLRQSFSRKRPFIDKHLACETMDMAINVFAYRQS